MKKEKIILVGGGGHCKSCIDVIEQEQRFQITGIISLPEKTEQNILGYKIIGSDEDLENIAKKYEHFFITIGQIKSPEKRIIIYEKLKKLNVNLPTIISPLAYVSKHAKIGDGTIIMHHAIINAGAKIGNNCIINNKALMEHYAVIEAHCHISTGGIINGGVAVGKGSFFGSGAISKEYVKIKEYSFIKANSIYKG